jgi:hypothetical protein
MIELSTFTPSAAIKIKRTELEDIKKEFEQTHQFRSLKKAIDEGRLILVD